MIETAIHRYGGWPLWHNLDSVMINVESIAGAIPSVKGIGRSFPQCGQMQVSPKEFRTIFFDRCGLTLGEFDSGTIRQEGAEPIDNYRARFAGLSKYRTWDVRDAMYFFGSAITTYLSVPFLLPDLRTRTEAWGEGFCVHAVFPKEIHTHCARQKFYFDREGLLLRHDYRAEILGRLAYGAHFTSDYEEVCGLPVARRRRVYARIGNWVTPVLVLSASLKPAAVVFRSDEPL